MAEAGTSMSFRGAVISVGGTPDPIVFSLKQHQPAFVLFLASEMSVATVKTVLPELGYSPQYEIVKVHNQEDLAESYEKLRTAIPRWLEQRSVAPEEVYVDMTGGAKPMSAALALAGSEYFGRFNYVGGAVRDKEGLGVVVSGAEKPLVVENPLDKLATRERERSRWLFANYHADAARHVLEKAAEKCGASLRPRLSTFAELLRLFAESDRFHFRNLGHQFRKIRAQLELILAEEYALFEKIDALVGHWDNVERESASDGEHVTATLRELLANAQRRACQGRYDDAIARLYRAAELFVQGELHKAFAARLGVVKLEAVPAESRDKFREAFRFDRESCKLGIETGFRALCYSPLPEQHEIAGRYEDVNGHLQKRNGSILAHGLRPASCQDFEKFWTALLPVLTVTEDDIPRWPQFVF